MLNRENRFTQLTSVSTYKDFPHFFLLFFLLLPFIFPSFPGYLTFCLWEKNWNSNTQCVVSGSGSLQYPSSISSLYVFFVLLSFLVSYIKRSLHYRHTVLYFYVSILIFLWLARKCREDRGWGVFRDVETFFPSLTLLIIWQKDDSGKHGFSTFR